MRAREYIHSEIVDRWREAGWPPVQELLSPGPPGTGSGDWEALIKPGLGRRERWRFVPQDPEARPLYLKRYPRPRLREQWDRAWRQTTRHGRAWWEFEQARRLREAHVPTAAPVACAERVFAGVELAGLVVLEAAPGEALDRLWPRLVASNAAITRGLAKVDFIERLARFIAAFHGTGNCHRDLYLCHVFADVSPNAERPPEFCLIDLARSHRPRWRRMRWILKDLAQLDVSARQIGVSQADRLRFLRAYLGLLTRSPRLGWYASRTIRRSSAILRRIARRAARSS